ncbi:hypothetical protein INT47_005642 [Mucor saturninus]|uniref:Integrase catalytic domain-containing protein n=1 Tax=Mucor saturninus TaxID=64648 RepID=A0A8H7QF67_9FUNG|nr:hypothetical protein INT47_005642 [Mucor saturninus]
MEFPLYLAIYYFLTRNGEFPNGSDQKIKRKVKSQASKYLAHHGKLFRKDLNTPIEQELLHQGNAQEVISRVHQEGHFGINNTWRQLRTQYTGPNLFELVRSTVQNCEACQFRSKKMVHRSEPAHPIPTPHIPFYMVGCDAVGPIPTSKNGHRYILVAVDYLTRWPIAEAVQEVNEQTTAQFLFKQIVTQYGVPSYLLTDRGSNFTSGFVRSFLSQLGCRHLTTTAYRPQTNGLCERLNQTLIQTLSKVTRDQDTQDSWDESIPATLLALRTMHNNSTRQTPARLLYGYDLRTPTTWPAPRQDFIQGDLTSEISSRVKIIQGYIQDIRAKAQELSNQQKEKQKERYDQKVTPRKNFVPGEQVLLRDQNPPTKLSDRWIGPFTVTQVKTNGTYVLTGPNFQRFKNPVHGDRLIPFFCHKAMVPDVITQRAQQQFQAWIDRNQTI